MRRLLVSCAVATTTTVGLSLVPPAHAAPTDPATLVCEGREEVQVTGFGRGQVLQLVGSTQTFVVTRAVTGGVTVFDNPGQARRADLVDCTTTTPRGTDYEFTGFFTPRG
jgi:hypothetical protein